MNRFPGKQSDAISHLTR